MQILSSDLTSIVPHLWWRIAFANLAAIMSFGWIKVVAGQEKTKFCGRDRVGRAFTFAAAAFNVVGLPNLMAETG